MKGLNHNKLQVLIWLLVMLPGLAAASAGKLLFARGDVNIVGQDGQQRTGEPGSELFEADHVLTGARSMAQIRLSDGALVSLRSRSDYQIEVQEEEEGLMEQAGTLFQGWMRKVSGAIGRDDPDSVSDKTPVATIGIRGTVYQIIHIPEGGLPGYEDTEPGTYVYLEEGRAHTTAGGETRFLEPGDVVFVGEDGVPRPAPDKKSLFLSGDGERVEIDDGEDEDFGRRINDSLDDRFGGGKAVSSLPGGGAISTFTVGESGGPLSMSSAGKDVSVATSESGRQLLFIEQEGGLARFFAEADEGAMPEDTGRYTLAGGAILDWGVWRQGDYGLFAEFDEDGAEGPDLEPGGQEGGELSPGVMPAPSPMDWHYMIADQSHVTALSVQNLGLTGEYTYDLVGGTTLTSDQGEMLDLADGSIVVDFDNLGTTDGMLASLTLANAALGYNQVFSGSGAIESFYNTGGGIALAGQSTGSGYIFGQFAGSNADGIISGVHINETLDDVSQWFNGAAGFALPQEPETNPQDPANLAAMGVLFAENTEYGNSAVIRATSPDITVRDEGSERVVADLDFIEQGDGGEFALSSVAGQTPSVDSGTVTLNDSAATRIDWGIWDGSQYSLTVDTNDIAEGDRNDWHYMVADNYLDQASLTDMAGGQLTGSFQYDAVGGTLAPGPDAINPGYTGGVSGSIIVDFDALAAESSPQMYVDLTAFANFTGYGTIQEFYTDGIALSGGDSGSIEGRFVGENAEGIISNVELWEASVGPYYGTVGFEQGSAAAIPPPP